MAFSLQSWALHGNSPLVQTTNRAWCTDNSPIAWLEGDFGPIRAIDGSEQSISRGFLEQNDQIFQRKESQV